ncbi:hypothetical protein [Pseudoalteromonas ardens]|uniref:Uncharacterized protein n=1 Tax=Pseudoalteromonas rubra TaxID=43658 RepID=A0A0L0EU55_9GAMM|nr:hypothetical protein [Pseudoalteromonas sp. R96]KNC67408.1 hypothetical protein AC626_10905 [Pseudoalteromonas rubra]MDK1310263.1 hypothetical protein [Pseudoalteromonas sp. R96]
MASYIELNRKFSAVVEKEGDNEQGFLSWALGDSSHQTWKDVLRKYRCVLLAEAGAGKSEEFEQQASILDKKGLPAFFIRIEDIDSEFEDAFEVGTSEQFNDWLESEEEAWFFLDSVDEARLASPAAFRKAITKFARRITCAKHRAHVFISSRPYSWQPVEDRKLMDKHLFLPEAKDTDSEEESTENKGTLEVLILRPLDVEQVETYCHSRNVENVGELINEIQRLGLWSLAERPFDLETIIGKWKDDNELGSRLELLRHNIKEKLTDKHSTDRSTVQVLDLKRAQEGARSLAAAAVLTGKAGMLIPGASSSSKGVCAKEVLNDWPPSDVQSLLELGIFNDVVYETVRFRHRDIKELLAAEWFETLLQSGANKYSVEGLFFKELYGEKIITPRLRPVLTWLLLFDDGFRQQAESIAPEVAVEGGDPAILPLPIRVRLLRSIVQKIVDDEYDRGARDNTAIARIATPDLSPVAIELIQQYKENDDAIFYLGRLAWQGKMVKTLSLLEGIVLNSHRGIYARRAALRAIITLGKPSFYLNIWERLNQGEEDFPQQLLLEFLEHLSANAIDEQQLLTSLEKLEDCKKKYMYLSVRRALTNFIKILSVQDDLNTICYLLEGLIRLITQEPYETQHDSKLSQKYSWLASNTAQLIAKVITARNPVALSNNVVSTLIMLPTAKYSRQADFNDYKENLRNIVPEWPELNDTLYWASVDQARTKLKAKNESLKDDWEIRWNTRFWFFDHTSYKRLIPAINASEIEDNQLVALSTVIHVYQDGDKPQSILNDLKMAVTGNDLLQGVLQRKLGPTASPKSKHQIRREETEKRERKVDEFERKQRQGWIKALQANPSRVNSVEGKLTDDVLDLFRELQDDNYSFDISCGAQWKGLIPEFGESVATEYKRAILAFWRHYDVALQSESNEYDSTRPAALSVAMAGLEVEYREVSSFPLNLSSTELEQALRYLAKELHGFSAWFESLYKAFPTDTLEAVITELKWELEYTGARESVHYILYNLLHYAPWIHKALTPFVFDWLMDNPDKVSKFPEYCVQIIIRGQIGAECLIELAQREIGRELSIELKARWFALWVDCHSKEAIPAFKEWLGRLAKESAKSAAEVFVVELVGGLGCCESYKTPEYLKNLYILIHKYVHSADDIDRTDGGVYSPALRDDAQDARSRLFSLLAEIPGKAAYVALRELESEHPEPGYRPWMAKMAYKRAESDADIAPWNAEQVVLFEHKQLITPKTHRQLFELGVQQLNSLKAWLENGNDSPWETWQKAKVENELRNLIAGWLNQNSQRQYSVPQEFELANGQRMDIGFQSNYISFPVPIELKLLDKRWSGNDLCERLRNQLVGDYLRADGASCGIMLLVAADTYKKWIINGKSTTLQDLRGALKGYWDKIACNYPDVDAVEVIVIDLSIRGKVSDS